MISNGVGWGADPDSSLDDVGGSNGWAGARSGHCVETKFCRRSVSWDQGRSELHCPKIRLSGRSEGPRQRRLDGESGNASDEQGGVEGDGGREGQESKTAFRPPPSSHSVPVFRAASLPCKVRLVNYNTTPESLSLFYFEWIPHTNVSFCAEQQPAAAFKNRKLGKNNKI